MSENKSGQEGKRPGPGAPKKDEDKLLQEIMRFRVPAALKQKATARFGKELPDMFRAWLLEQLNK